MANETLFSSGAFVEAVSRSMGNAYRPVAIPVEGSGNNRKMYGTAAPAPYLSMYISLAPFGLFASPGWENTLERSTVEGILRFLKRPVTRGFVWTIRYDQIELANTLNSLGLASTATPTHVIDLERSYADVAAAYSATIRNQIGKARRRGVTVRCATGEADVRAYHELHSRLVEQAEWRGHRYPLTLLVELARLGDSVRLLLAEYEGQVIGGGLFFLDGNTVLYWHGVSDRAHSERFASRVLLDEAIRWAHQVGAKSVNLGGSAGLESIERFKSMWGARVAMNQTFEWANPLWEALSTAKARLIGAARSRDS